MTCDGEEMHVDTLEERIDNIEREINGETYKIWTKKVPISKLGEVRLLIAEKVTDNEDEENPVRYLPRTRLTRHLLT